MGNDVLGILRIYSTERMSQVPHSEFLNQSSLTPIPLPLLLTLAYWPKDHKFPQVFLFYSVMIAVSRVGQNGPTYLILVPCRKARRKFKNNS